MKAAKQEAYPLAWPDGWLRTRIRDRREQSQWKLSMNKYRDLLIRELERMGATSLVLSSNVPLNLRGDLTAGVEPTDPGVAIYFSRKVEEDYSWQDALEIKEPAPSLEQIEAAFKRLARQYHPDAGGDPAMFVKLIGYRDKARAWITRQQSGGQQFVLACDAFTEVRLNINAVRMTVAAIRQIERCGASSLLERAFKGFSALPEHIEVGASEVA